MFSPDQKRGWGFEPPQIFGPATETYRQRATKRHKTLQNAAKGGGGRVGAHGGIFIAAGVVVPLIGSGGGSGVICSPCRRDEDTRVVTVLVGVVVNVNGTAIAVTAAIVVFVVLTAAATNVIAAAAAQPLLPLSL